MQYIQGQARQQAALFPVLLDECIPADHPVRVIDAFVDQLDLSGLGFGKARPRKTGRPPYNPGDLLKLYIYGYLNQGRSSRRLERESQRNIEVRWLLNRLCPDFKTIANFRKDNGEAIRGVCRTFTLFCRDFSLFGAELVAIDGSKFPAVANQRQMTPKSQWERALTRAEAKVSHYMTLLEQGDASEVQSSLNAEATEQALSALRARREALQQQVKAMHAACLSQYVASEPDAKILGGRGHPVIGYNVQTAVDSKHKLIVHHDVTSEGNDNRQLYPMAFAAKETLSVEQLTVVADTGYHNGEHAAACEAKNILPVLPCQRAVNPKGNYFSKEAFIYEAATDTYRCPANQSMVYKTVSNKEQLRLYSSEACTTCPRKLQCTSGKQRWVSRHFFADALQRMNQRAHQHSELLPRRREIVEHPFANLKQMRGKARFLTRGLHKVRTEMAWSVLTYNLKWVMRILTPQKLLHAWVA